MTLSRFDALRGTILRRLRDFLELGDDDERVRRLEAEADALKARLGAALAARRRLSLELSAIDPQSDDLDAGAEHALRAGRDDLARAAIARKVEIERRRAEIEREFSLLDETASGLERMIVECPGAGAGLASRLAELEAMLAEAGRDPEPRP